jgi:N-acetylneuraminic acid mutarotase
MTIQEFFDELNKQQLAQQQEQEQQVQKTTNTLLEIKSKVGGFVYSSDGTFDTTKYIEYDNNILNNYQIKLFGVRDGEKGYGGCTELYNNKIYMFGGKYGSSFKDELWSYDIELNKWSQLSSGATARRYPASALYNDDIYVYGGDDGSKLDDLWKYNITTDTWTQITTALTGAGRYGHTMDIKGDELIITGGSTSAGITTDVISYNLVTQSLTYLPPLHTSTYLHASVLVGDNLYIHGGYNGGAINNFAFYNFTDGTWNDLDIVTKKSLGHNMVYYNNKIYMILGAGYSGGFIYDNTIRTFDLTTGEYDSYTVDVIPKIGMSCTLKDNFIYLFDGNGANTTLDNTLLERINLDITPKSKLLLTKV